MFQKREVQFKASMSGAANGKQALRPALTAPSASNSTPTLKKTPNILGRMFVRKKHPFTRRSHLLGAALKLQHPSIRSTRSTFQQIAGASSRADRSSRAKSRPDTEKDSKYTSMFVRKKRPLRAAFASPRRSAGNSSFFNRKRIIRLSPRWPPELPSRVRVGQRTPKRKRGVCISLAQTGTSAPFDWMRATGKQPLCSAPIGIPAPGNRRAASRSGKTLNRPLRHDLVEEAPPLKRRSRLTGAKSPIFRGDSHGCPPSFSARQATAHRFRS